MSTSSSSSLKMKLLVDTKTNRVLFAEVNKDVVDFLFSLLALPVATIVEMLGREFMTGSFGNLYGSVKDLDYTYILPHVEKRDILSPKVVPSAARTSRSSLLLPAPSSGQPKSFRCSYHSYNCYNYVTNTSGTKCPSCGGTMSVALTSVPPETDGSGCNVKKASSTQGAKGFVKGVVTYTVKDDLTVTPMSTISSITMLNTAGVNNFAALQEKTVRLGYIEVIDLSIYLVLMHSVDHCLFSWSTIRLPVRFACFAGSQDCQGVAALQHRPHRRFPRDSVLLKWKLAAGPLVGLVAVLAMLPATPLFPIKTLLVMN
jgi:hypothetical protein